MMWGPTLNGPMTHFVPQVIAEEKIVLMWERWNQSYSPKSASPTLYPHPGRSKLPSSPDISKLHKCWTSVREGRRVFLALLHLWGKSVKSNPEAYCSDLVKTNYNNWSLSVQLWASFASLQTLSTEVKETTYRERNVIHISVTVTSIRCDGGYFVIVLHTLPTHNTHIDTNTHRYRSNCVW